MRFHTAIALSLVAILAAGCETASESNPLASVLMDEPAPRPIVEVQTPFNPRLLRRFAPLAAAHDADGNVRTAAKVELGRMLYFERRLSKNHDLSCNSCHQLSRYGVDAESTSPGHHGQRGQRNAPTTYNSAVSFVQFWDGRVDTVEKQVTLPIFNPTEMAAPNKDYVLRVLGSMPEYVDAFERAFPDEEPALTLDNLSRAIGAFERGLVTPSRWDDFLRGDKRALSKDEIEGLKIFTNVGCMVCHTGELLGGSMFQKAGAVEPWPNQDDQGRFAVTQSAGDRMMFKVPTLRNVTKTAPYFHDGSVDRLDDAIVVMGRHQLGLELMDDEVAAIALWLNALTGEIPEEYIAAPELPKSTAQTPPPRAD